MQKIEKGKRKMIFNRRKMIYGMRKIEKGKHKMIFNRRKMKQDKAKFILYPR